MANGRLDVSRREQPGLRGVFHQYAVALFLAAGIVLVALAGSAKARVAMLTYAIGVVGCLGMSTLLHRGRWSVRVKEILDRVDHAAIFVLIAGTYTPLCLLVLSGPLAVGLLIGVWAGAIFSIGLTLAWWYPPAWVEVTPYIVLGWMAVLAIPQINDTLGWGALIVMGSGGALYTAGAVVYAAEKPDPFPKVFGYHEIFHLCTVAAATLHIVLMFVWVLPRR